jgi:hypothetical protein
MSPTTKNLHHFYQGKEVKLQLYLHPYCWLVSVIYGCTVILRIPVGPILKYGTSAYRHKNHWLTQCGISRECASRQAFLASVPAILMIFRSVYFATRLELLKLTGTLEYLYQVPGTRYFPIKSTHRTHTSRTLTMTVSPLVSKLSTEPRQLSGTQQVLSFPSNLMDLLDVHQVQGYQILYIHKRENGLVDNSTSTGERKF